MKTHPIGNPLVWAILTLAAAYLAATPARAAAATWTWNGGGGNANWSTAGNWTSTTSPGTSPASDTGTTIQMAGTTNLNVNVDSPFTLTNLTFNSGAGAFTLSGSTLSIYNTSNNNTSLENNSTSAMTINNNIDMIGSAMFRTTSGNMTLNGNINLNGNTLTFRPIGTMTMNVNGVISGAGGIYNNASVGTAITKLNGANTYTGSTTVYAGTVIVGVSDVGSPGALTSGAFGVATSAVTLGAANGTADVILETGGAYTVTRDFQMVSTDPDAITLGGATAATSTFSGNVIDGSATSGSTNYAAHAFTLTAATGGRVNFTGNIVRATGATGTSDSMTKSGAGIVSLSGSTIGYLGTTAVNAGTLLVNGTMASGGGAVTVASGAALGGSGIINRAVAISSGGILTPGDMDASGNSLTGTLTLGGDLTLASGSILKFDLGTARDLVAVTGNLTLGGTLNVLAGSGFGAGTYELFSYTGTLTNNGLTLGTLPSGYGYTLDTSTAGMVDLVVAVPEPGIPALLGIGVGLLGVFLLRRHCVQAA